MRRDSDEMNIDAFRGQYGSPTATIHSKLPSITFGSFESANVYALFPNSRNDIIVKSIVLAATIQINNPIIHNTDDCFADFDILIEKLGADFIWHIADKYETSIYATDNWGDNFFEYINIS